MVLLAPSQKETRLLKDQAAMPWDRNVLTRAQAEWVFPLNNMPSASGGVTLNVLWKSFITHLLCWTSGSLWGNIYNGKLDYAAENQLHFEGVRTNGLWTWPLSLLWQPAIRGPFSLLFRFSPEELAEVFTCTGLEATQFLWDPKRL